MSRTKDRKPARPTELDDARNELFSHIHRCGVMKATEDQQVEWMKDTVEFLGERYPSMGETELKELHDIGLRFCRPVIVNGVQSEDEAAAEDEAAEEDTQALAEEATAA